MSNQKKYGAELFAEGIMNKKSLLGNKWILPCNKEKQMKSQSRMMGVL